MRPLYPRHQKSNRNLKAVPAVQNLELGPGRGERAVSHPQEDVIEIVASDNWSWIQIYPINFI